LDKNLKLHFEYLKAFNEYSGGTKDTLASQDSRDTHIEEILKFINNRENRCVDTKHEEYENDKESEK